VFSVGRYVGLLVPSQPSLDELSITFETSDVARISDMAMASQMRFTR